MRTSADPSLIYKGAVYHQYSYFVKYRSHRRKKIVPWRRITPKEWDNFFYCETSISLNIGKVFYMISLYVSINGHQRYSWSFFETFTCWTCLTHLVNLAKNIDAFTFIGKSSTSESPKKKSWGPLLNLNWYIQVGCLLSILIF